MVCIKLLKVEKGRRCGWMTVAYAQLTKRKKTKAPWMPGLMDPETEINPKQLQERLNSLYLLCQTFFKSSTDK